MRLQHIDPHDAIAAQLRDLTPRPAHDPAKLNVTSATSSKPASESSLRTTPLNDTTSDIRILTPRARSGRGVVLLAVCASVAATMAWHSYGDEAKQRLSHLVPQFLADAPTPTQSANTAEPRDVPSEITASQPATAQAATQESSASSAAPTPPASAPATPAAETPPTQAALAPELTQSIETMAREISSLKHTVEQLQVSQQQLSHDIAKVSEHGTRNKLVVQTSKPTPPPRPKRAPLAADSRTLAPYSPPQAHSQGQTHPQGAAQREAYIPPPAPTQLPPQPSDSSVPRPPMPLR